MNQLIKQIFYTGTLASMLMFSISCKPKEDLTLKAAFADKFLVGVAMNAAQITGEDQQGLAVIKQHFNSIVAENCMKSEHIHPVEGEFDFTLPDQMVEFGTQNNMTIIGHTLVWHSQTPAWFFVDENGEQVSKDIMIERMKTHIQTIVQRYKGRIYGWDVINEAFEDDGTLRKTPFYNIIGEEYLELAFRFAHEADPQAKLFYNDYNMAVAKKAEAVIALVKDLASKGVKVDGIGMQGHLMMDFPDSGDFEKSLIALAETGAEIMITELDLSPLPNPYSKRGAEISLQADYQELMNPYKDGLSEEVYQEWEARFLNFYELFLKHQDKISRVTLWGLTDADSWKNDWPIKGRTDYPLLFERSYQAKGIVKKLTDMANCK